MPTTDADQLRTSAMPVQAWLQQPEVRSRIPAFRDTRPLSEQMVSTLDWSLLHPLDWLFGSGISASDFTAFNEHFADDEVFSAHHLCFRLDQVAGIVPAMPLWCAVGWVMAFFDYYDGGDQLPDVLALWGGIRPHTGFLFLQAGIEPTEMWDLHRAGTLPDQRALLALAALREALLPVGAERAAGTEPLPS